MTATLKTESQTFEYNFENQIVDNIVVFDTEPEIIKLTKPRTTGIATTRSCIWKEVLMSDLLYIISTPHTGKVKQLKKIAQVCPSKKQLLPLDVYLYRLVNNNSLQRLI